MNAGRRTVAKLEHKGKRATEKVKNILRPPTPGEKDLAKSAAKLLLKILKEVSESLPPLKSVAAGLNILVENAEVRSFLTFSLHSHSSCYHAKYS
jgi:hypothetical protein